MFGIVPVKSTSFIKRIATIAANGPIIPRLIIMSPISKGIAVSRSGGLTIPISVAEKLMNRVNWWKNIYSLGRDVQINGTVSPGNQKGGLANILEKSLGSAMKGGTTGLMEVYNYAEKVEKKGFVFMDTPGFDPVSATGQIAGGANLIAFTTGRGSCFGAKPTPSEPKTEFG